MADLTGKANLAKAIIKVMNAVVGVEKNLNVGYGNSSYKGVGDQDVKKVVGDAMEKNGLCILPIDIEPTVEIKSWMEGERSKQQVFTQVKTKYLLLHESGECIELVGYGHGVDSQDKSAGKATTYALKYTLLYAFLVPTGKIDDADKHSSEEILAPPPASENKEEQKLPFFRIKYETIAEIEDAMKDVKTLGQLAALYQNNADKIEKAPGFKADFTAKKEALQNTQIPV